MKVKKEKKIDNEDFSLMFGDDKGWFRSFGKWVHLVITSKGVYFNGNLIAGGKLKLVPNHLLKR